MANKKLNFDTLKSNQKSTNPVVRTSGDIALNMTMVANIVLEIKYEYTRPYYVYVTNIDGTSQTLRSKNKVKISDFYT